MSRPNAKFSAFFENSQKTAGFSANGPPKARCSGQKPRHGRADTVFCLGAERGPRPLLFPGRLAQALPPCIRRLLWALFSPPAAGKAFPSKGGSCAEKQRTVCPRFPHAASEKRCPPPAAIPAWEQGAAHAAAALPCAKRDRALLRTVPLGCVMRPVTAPGPSARRWRRSARGSWCWRA